MMDTAKYREIPFGAPVLTPDTRLALARAGIWFRDCPICGFPYVGGKGGQTGHQIYCSNACRQKAYRLRHGQRYTRPGRPRTWGDEQAEAFIRRCHEKLGKPYTRAAFWDAGKT